MKTCRKAQCDPSDCCGAAVIVQWLPHDQPMPEGWRYAPARKTKHSRYANLIERSGN